MEELIREMPIDAKVRAALSGEPGPATELHRLVLAYEKGDWPAVVSRAALFGIKGSTVAKAYSGSLAWYNHFTAVNA